MYEGTVPAMPKPRLHTKLIEVTTLLTRRIWAVQNVPISHSAFLDVSDRREIKVRDLIGSDREAYEACVSYGTIRLDRMRDLVARRDEGLGSEMTKFHVQFEHSSIAGAILSE